MLLSIIIPTYNSEKTITQTLSSIFKQKYEDHKVEVLIVDGLSTDGTLKIIESFGSLVTRIISERDSGIYDAMNKGVDAANGRFCYFIGAGDILIDGVLQHILPQLEEFNGFLYGNVIRTKGNVIYDGEFSVLKIFRRNICHQAIFYPSNELKKYHYDLKYRVLADYNLNLLLFSRRDLKKKYVNINIAYYDDLSQGFSSKNTDQYFIDDYPNIILNNFSLRYKIAFISLSLMRRIKKVIR